MNQKQPESYRDYIRRVDKQTEMPSAWQLISYAALSLTIIALCVWYPG